MSIAANLRVNKTSDDSTPEACSVRYIAYGVRFQLSSNREQILKSMQNAVPFGSAISEAVTGAWLIFSLDEHHQDQQFSLRAGDGAPAYADQLQPLLEQLRTELIVYVADNAVDRVFVHAGVVGWQGSALIFPGPSFAGKSTLIAALVRAGATYYSDEYAVLDEHGRVYPYARDLQMRQPGGTVQTGLPAASLSAKVGEVSLPVVHVIFANYVPEARWVPQPLSAGMAVLEMLRHTIPVQRFPTRVMSTLAAMMRTATAVRSERGEAPETAESILRGRSLKAGPA